MQLMEDSLLALAHPGHGALDNLPSSAPWALLLAAIVLAVTFGVLVAYSGRR